MRTPCLGVRVVIVYPGLLTHLSPPLIQAELSQRYKSDGMLAYTQLVQDKERELGIDFLTHQKWYVQAFCI